jgi:hypothetical protein
LSKIDFGNGFGFWNTIPIRFRTSTGSTCGPYRSWPWYRHSPSTSAVGIRSFIRFRQRIKVLLPQPDGPINAVISLRAISIVTSLTAG